MSAPSPRPRVARWRVALACAILIVLAIIAIRLAPVYFRNVELQQYVADLTQRVENQNVPDDALRTRVLERAAELDLPVAADNVHIKHTPEGMRIDVRYIVHVELPLYTVDLHFYPGAGSR